MNYEAVIGLEVHVQLKTASKMFTRAPYRYGEAPNTLTDPVVLGLPGTLPVMNREAVEKSAAVGLLFGSTIPGVCKWDRKNYFYPDSPKNYQISQYDQPICVGGEVEIELPGPSRNIMGEHRRVRLTRAHLEEDVGKLTHFPNDSLVDYNRAGAPLLEIVSEPDIFSSAEAVAFLNALRVALVAAGISDCDMEKGQLRCDANVSVRPAGSDALNTRTEMKNLNSVSGVKNAIDYEVRRQIKLVESGGDVVQETRRWDAEAGVTTSMRSKEEAHDYRYFPDPDLMPVKLPPETLERIRERLPELPFDRQRRFMDDYGLPYTVTQVLCPDRPLADYFEEAVRARPGRPVEIANLVANDLLRELAAAGGEGAGPLPLDQSPVRPAQIAELVGLVDDGTISKQIAKEVFVLCFQSGDDPGAIVEEKGLQQSQDSGEIEAFCRQAIADNPKPVEEFRAGKEKALNRLVGQVMKASAGKANPQAVIETLKRLAGE